MRHRLQAPALRQPNAGFTLVEALISLAVLAVLVAVAVPSMYEFIMRKRVEGAADELLGDFRLARSMQSRDNRDTIIKFSRTDTETCYVVFHPNSRLNCDCTSTPVCESRGAAAAVELKTVRLPASGKVTVQPANGGADSVRLLATTGLPKDGATLSVDITAPSGGTARLWTTGTGRVQLCSVSGHASAYPACPAAESSP